MDKRLVLFKKPNNVHVKHFLFVFSSADFPAAALEAPMKN